MSLKKRHPVYKDPTVYLTIFLEIKVFNVQGVFLSDIFEMLITPSILKISSFCKAVMTNQTGQFHIYI